MTVLYKSKRQTHTIFFLPLKEEKNHRLTQMIMHHFSIFYRENDRNSNKKLENQDNVYLHPNDCLIPVKMSPNDLPIIHTRKKDTALLTLVKTVFTKGMVISENSRNKLK